MRLSVKLNCATTLLAGLVCLLGIAACTPSHTVQKSEFYARKIGVINQFDISRWHGRRLPANSRILVAAGDVKAVDGAHLSRVVSDNLAPFFADVNALEQQQALLGARSAARRQSYNFLFYIELIDSKTGAVLTDNSDADDGAAPQDASRDFRQLQLLLVVVDALNGNTVDKIRLSASTARYNFLGTDMASLLAKPLAAIGRDLTGV